MLELYYYENSVCSERVLMTLAEKGIDDWVPHHLDLFKGEQADPAYIKLNPKAQVPTLVHDSAVIRESSVICDYLDDIYPSPPLTPDAASGRARMREWVKEADEAGFQGVAALSFTAVFREKMLNMDSAKRDQLWAEQTDLARTFRQKSCVHDGLASPHAIVALVSWDQIFDDIEEASADGRDWVMGKDFTLADLNLAPFVARLEGISFLDIWLAKRPRTAAWWNRLKSRPSFLQARVGPGAGEEAETFAREGRKAAPEARRILAELTASKRQ